MARVVSNRYSTSCLAFWRILLVSFCTDLHNPCMEPFKCCQQWRGIDININQSTERTWGWQLVISGIILQPFRKYFTPTRPQFVMEVLWNPSCWLMTFGMLPCSCGINQRCTTSTQTILSFSTVAHCLAATMFSRLQPRQQTETFRVDLDTRYIFQLYFKRATCALHD
jgi:hypothetical protein